MFDLNRPFEITSDPACKRKYRNDLKPQFIQIKVAPGFRREAFVDAAARALALCLGCFSLLNLIGNFRLPGFDANLWWIDLRALPEIPAMIFFVGGVNFSLSLCLAPSVFVMAAFSDLWTDGRPRFVEPLQCARILFAAVARPGANGVAHPVFHPGLRCTNAYSPRQFTP